MKNLNSIYEAQLSPTEHGVEFLWLELTEQCNLECIHCYADSSPRIPTHGHLSTVDYKRVIEEAKELGCRQLQFIGGEPTIYRDVQELLDYSSRIGFDFIEIYTNAVRIPDSLLGCFKENDINVAFSFYCHNPEIHDTITSHNGSHSRTVANIKNMVAAGVPLRAGIVSMPENEKHISDTVYFLQKLGVYDVGVDCMRHIGRGVKHSQKQQVMSETNHIDELCGQCWKSKLCISAQGDVYPCIMARDFRIGSILESSLTELVVSSYLHDTRQLIKEKVWQQQNNSECDPMFCRPTVCFPSCNPGGRSIQRITNHSTHA